MKNDIPEIINYVNNRLESLHDALAFELSKEFRVICNAKISELQSLKKYLYTFKR